MVHIARALVIALVVLVALAGCSGGGSDRIVDSGTETTVSPSALDATDYERVGTTTKTLNATVKATVSGDVELDADQPVTANIPVTIYRTDTDCGTAVFSVAASPAVRPIENQPIRRDPLATRSPTERTNLLQSTYTVESPSERANETVRLLGNDTVAVSYAAESDRGTVTVTITSVRDGEEFVTVVAVAPRSEADSERFQRLLDGVTR